MAGELTIEWDWKDIEEDMEEANALPNSSGAGPSSGQPTAAEYGDTQSTVIQSRTRTLPIQSWCVVNGCRVSCRFYAFAGKVEEPFVAL